MIKLPITSDSGLQKFLRENKDTLNKYLVRTISEELDKDELSFPVELFQMGNSEYRVVITLKNCNIMLNDALKYFVKMEMYEDAANCRDLIVRVAIAEVSEHKGKE